MKKLIKDLIPPIILKLLRKAGIKSKKKLIEGKELGANWYDERYKVKSVYHDHYTKSPYYFTWCVIVERLNRMKPVSILDLGCGPGQFAKLLSDKGYKSYIGIDFSKESIKMAKSLCPNLNFHIDNILTTDLLEKKAYQCVIILEFLEHIEKDIEVLEKIKSGASIIATVPSYNSAGHVRYFSSIDEVKKRYAPIFVDEPDVTDWLLSSENNARFFLLQGIKK